MEWAVERYFGVGNARTLGGATGRLDSKLSL